MITSQLRIGQGQRRNLPKYFFFLKLKVREWSYELVVAHCEVQVPTQHHQLAADFELSKFSILVSLTGQANSREWHRLSLRDVLELKSPQPFMRLHRDCWLAGDSVHIFCLRVIVTGDIIVPEICACVTQTGSYVDTRDVVTQTWAQSVVLTP